MFSVTVDLTEEQLAKLNEEASHLGVTAEELARARIIDAPIRSKQEFQKAADHVLAKNEKLYRRLA